MDISNSKLLPPATIPDDLIAKILLLLSFKTIVQLKCVSKSWNTLISDPTFVQKHLNKSSQKPHLILTPPTRQYPMSSIKSFPVSRLLETPPITVSGDSCHGSMNYCKVVGSCNGLLCLLFQSRCKTNKGLFRKFSFCLWNPAMRTMSQKLGTFYDPNPLCDSKSPIFTYDLTYKFAFGCDISTGDYKVVALRKAAVIGEGNDGWKSQVRVYNFCVNFWRNVPKCPLTPLCLMVYNNDRTSNGLYFYGTVNWLALSNHIWPWFYEDNVWKCVANAKQFMIVSLDLSTETYTQISPPLGFDEVPRFSPNLHVMMDCLCFSHDFKGIEFVIWQMKEFGVQESWTRLFRIDYFRIYHDLDFNGCSQFGTPLLPLYLSKNGDTLILANYEDDRAIIYNRRDQRVEIERIRISNKLFWFSAMDYVESLVSPPWKSATPTPSTSFPHDSMVGKSILIEDDSEIGDTVEDSSEEDEGSFLYLDELSYSESEDELSK
ncbi:F-box/kelch-repeat protein At3g23880-like [Trifolium pratense]|uniref:F-box/kelch-repeat protein At3g23880-like n=1 Tax=Trifolium pratense TaxID=57577 RepID=UPI001E690476|nr:F-box/kelch-repeat protein At3g23880-like [Trifolium pratense]